MFGLLRRGAAFAAVAASAAVACRLRQRHQGRSRRRRRGKQLFVAEMRRLPRARPRRHERQRRPGPRRRLRAVAQRRLRAQRVDGVVKRADPLPERLGQDAGEARHGPGRRRHRRLRRGLCGQARRGHGCARDRRQSRRRRERPTAQGGKLEIDANPDGQLAYEVSSATAPTGALQIDSRNASSVPHDIALQEGTDGSSARRGRDRLQRRRLDRRRSASDPADTRSTARCPAIARPACRAR